MKKVNKTLLLASTLLISSSFIGNEVYADKEGEDAGINTEENLVKEEGSTSKLEDLSTYQSYSLDQKALEVEEEAYPEEKALSDKEEAYPQTIDLSEVREDTKASEKPSSDEDLKDQVEKDPSLDENKDLDNEEEPEKTTRSVEEEDQVVYYDTYNLDEEFSDDLEELKEMGNLEENKVENTPKPQELVVNKGITEIDGTKYLFDNNGKLQTNTKIVTDDTYYESDSKGILHTKKDSWVKVEDKTYRTDKDGKLLKGIKKVGDDYYNFDQKGAIDPSLKVIKEDKLLMADKEGKVSNPKNFWFAIGGKTYRTGAEGSILKGIQNVNNNTYIFEKDGVMVQNKNLMTAGRYYQVNNKGLATNPKNAWVDYEGKKYHTNANGYIQEGIWNIDGKLYYFTKDGLTGNKLVSQKGIDYKVDANGIASPIVTSKKNLDKVIEWMFTARKAGLTYDMSWSGRNSQTAADCSSAVYRALIYGGFLDKGSAIGNTETLFKLGAEGQVMYQIDESDIKYGDIFVAGNPGGSLGAAGHTGFILNEKEDTIIHMSYGKNGVAVTPRKGYMGDSSGLPVRYYRLVGGVNNNIYINQK